MERAIDIAFYGNVGCLTAAACASALHARASHPHALRWALRLLVAAAAGAALCFLLRSLAWRHLPLTNRADALNLFVLLCATILLIVMHHSRAPAMMVFCLPPLALIAFMNAATAWPLLHIAPRALASGPLALHVGSAFLAYAFLFLAAVTSAAYLYQVRRLKERRIAGLFRQMPSLEQLDRTLFILIAHGYAAFLMAVALGLFWASMERHLLGPYWWLAPKVTLSLAITPVFAALFHLRRRGRLRGPRLAYLACWAFSVLLILYLLLSLVNLREVDFWRGGP